MVNFFFLDTDPKKCAEYYCDKHVNKILIEICQLLCNVIHNNTNLIAPYKKCRNISENLAPYKWANHSLGNYLYLLNLAQSLLNEYKFRYKKNEHKSEKVVIWLYENIPSHFKYTKRTKLFYTNNISLFAKYIKNDIKCSRLIYAVYKCKNDKWTHRDIPKWLNKLRKYVKDEHTKYKKKLMYLVKNTLTDIYKNNKNIKVKRFHSFLRIIYDNLFECKWNKYINQYKNMYTKDKPLVDQLSYIHLKECIKIGKLLKKEKYLTELNNKSLRFRNKKTKI